MATASRNDRLMKLIGEQNLPPKIPQPITKPDADDGTKDNEAVNDPFSKPETPSETTEETSSENWWDAAPQILRRQPSSNPQPGLRVISEVPPDSDGGFPFDERKDERASLGISFTPFGAVAKFPYKFVGKQWMQTLATAFFDENKIYSREWDIYYIWSDSFPTAQPVTFVPEHQLQALVDEINEAYPQAKVKITDSLREDGLVINFDDIEIADLRPRWLGRSTSRAQYDWWKDHLPYPANQPQMADGSRTKEAFKAKMELAAETTKAKSKAKKTQKQAENVIKRQEMVRSHLRAQRYLGLLPKPEEFLLPDLSNLSVGVDTTKSAPHPCDQDVIFIAIDVESWERAHHMITEIGVATLDTRSLRGHAPGQAGANWQQHIRGRHFRISEYKDKRNKDFIEGCPDKFEFGESEFIGLKTIPQKMASCFRPPFSGATAVFPDEKRNIVLVGHDINQDVNYLQKVGFNVLNSRNIIETMDTAAMYRVYTRDVNPRSLGGVLEAFDLWGWYLHNAGNDAVYTLWAMLAIAVQSAGERGSPDVEKKHAEVLEKRTEEAIERVKERIKDESEGWELDGNEDGGVALK